MDDTQTFEDAVKSFAGYWANAGGTHSDEVVTDLFDLILAHFPNWSSEDEATQHYIDYVK